MKLKFHPFAKMSSLYKEAAAKGKIKKGHLPRLIVAGVVILIIIIFLVSPGSRKQKQPALSGKAAVPLPSSVPSMPSSNLNAFTAGADEKVFIAKAETMTYQLQGDVNELKEKVLSLERKLDGLDKYNRSLLSKLENIDESISESVVKAIKSVPSQAVPGVEQPQAPVTAYAPEASARLQVFNVGPTTGPSKKYKYAYLPTGSFVRATILTGVYAPVDKEKPLPVLFSVDEAFIGPNKTRIPLKEIFAIAKAYGEITPERAILELVKLSCVWKDGTVFEKEGNLGYVAGSDGSLGLKGMVVSKVSDEMSQSFLTGFFSGASAALAESQTSTVSGPYGELSRNVTGNVGKYSIYQGLASSAQQMSAFYQKRLENLVDYIYIAPGQKAYLVMKEGVELEGYQVPDINKSASSFD